MNLLQGVEQESVREIRDDVVGARGGAIAFDGQTGAVLSDA
jgi:hypothetical protein